MSKDYPEVGEVWYVRLPQPTSKALNLFKINYISDDVVEFVSAIYDYKVYEGSYRIVDIDFIEKREHRLGL